MKCKPLKNNGSRGAPYVQGSEVPRRFEGIYGGGGGGGGGGVRINMPTKIELERVRESRHRRRLWPRPLVPLECTLVLT